ncbi:MAG: lysophospholipid acyltransferase family protein [Paludibacter sp.]|nr:lysophospholipid acyltransferase family protein [Paludibacter sp.]
MIRIISIPFSILAYLWFIVFLCIFHPIQWLCFKIAGYQAHKRSVDSLVFFLMGTLKLLLSTTKCKNRELIPQNKPLIFVSNHQGTFDIVGMQWYFRKFHPKFVSKIELTKGVPSISYNLRNGGSVLIDRNDPRQALPELKKMGEYIQKYGRSVIIYPEGTRTKDGKPKDFAPNGLKILCKYAPDALIVPVTINNSWKVFRYGSFPLGLGNRLTFTVHPPIAVNETDFNTLFEQTEKVIIEAIV